MQNYGVLIVQESLNDAEELAHGLDPEQFSARVSVDLEYALSECGSGNCDVLLLDASVGQQDCIAVCGELRRRGINIPILFVTSALAKERSSAAFRSGADDFLTRPCHPDELTLRIQAILRRCMPGARPGICCRVGGTVVDLGTGEAVCGRRHAKLTTMEIQLFAYLWRRREQVVSKSELLRDVWNYSSGDTRTVEVHVATLRRKLEREPHRPRHLVTSRGKGYVLTAL